jgi:KDO2-lipid IV(A) lauroyltransferase
MYLLIKLLSCLPLRHLQSIGAFLGLLTFWFSKKDRELIIENSGYAIAKYGIEIDPKAVAVSAGTMFGESLWIWTHPKKAFELTELVDWEEVDLAVKAGHGLLMLTAHLGSFEMIPMVLSKYFPATILYKAAKQSWLKRLIDEGRSDPRMNFVPANMQGVRQVARALSKGEAVGILPDQVPDSGEGVWAPFFGKPAFTSVLPTKISLKHGVPTIIFLATRKPRGQGWRIQASRLHAEFDNDPLKAATQLNEILEKLIIQYPEQYLWMYKRYKHTAGAPLPPGVKE